MESIVCLRSATINVTLPFQNHTRLLSFPRHPAGHLAVVGHLSFPRSARPLLRHRVSCSSHVPPPPPSQSTPETEDVVDRKKGRGGGWKGPRAAAASAAVVVACALGAVCMSRGPPAAAAFPVAQASPPPSMSDNEPTQVQKIRNEVYEILFMKKDCSTMGRGQMESTCVFNNWFADPVKYEAAFPLIEILLARRDYHEAKAVCEKIIKIMDDAEAASEKNKEPNKRQQGSDARPRILMAVIDMMLAVEAMLLPEKTKDVEDLIKIATASWEKYRDLQARGLGGDFPEITPDPDEQNNISIQIE